MTLLLMLLACDLEFQPGGILVGNPGEVSLDTAPHEGLQWRSGSLPLNEVLLSDCRNTSATIALGGTLDLLGGDSVELPPGDWCSLTVRTDGPLIWEADTEEGWSLQLQIEVESLSVSSSWGFITDEASLLLVVGAADTLDLAALAPGEGEDQVFVDSSHPSYDDVRRALTGALTLYDVTGLEGPPSEDHIVASDNCGCEDSGDTGACGDCAPPPVIGCGGCGDDTDFELKEAVLVPVFFLWFGWRRRRPLPEAT